MATLPSIVMMNNVRLDRVSLTTPFKSPNPSIDPKTGEKRPDKYHVDVIFAPNHPDFAAVQAAIRAVAQKRWGEHWQVRLKVAEKSNKTFCLQRGDEYRPGKPQFAGKLYISAGNLTQPTIVATIDGKSVSNRGTIPPLTPADDKWPYSGCYANVQLEFKAYDVSGGGVKADVLGVQFLKHGERLAGASYSSVSEFGIVPEDADARAPTTAAEDDGGGGLI